MCAGDKGWAPWMSKPCVTYRAFSYMDAQPKYRVCAIKAALSVISTYGRLGISKMTTKLVYYMSHFLSRVSSFHKCITPAISGLLSVASIHLSLLSFSFWSWYELRFTMKLSKQNNHITLFFQSLRVVRTQSRVAGGNEFIVLMLGSVWIIAVITTVVTFFIS